MNTQSIWNQQVKNTTQSLLLMGALMGLAGLTGYGFAGTSGAIFALILSIWPVLNASRISPKAQLERMGAQRVSALYHPQLVEMVANLSHKAGLERVPELYYLPTHQAQALSIGHKKENALAVTDGLLRRLSPRELEGVLAHEIAHIRHQDTWILSLAASMRQIVAAFTRITLILFFIGSLFYADEMGRIPLSILALWVATPTIATALQMALSRAREFDADLLAARITDDPKALASALYKINQANQPLWQRILGITPRHSSLFMTHPPTQARLARLQKLMPMGTF